MKEPSLKRQAIEQRSRARRQLIQTLYQWQLSGDEPAVVKANQIINPGVGELDEYYFDQAWDVITLQTDSLEALAIPYLPRPVNQLDPVERAILWLGLFELSQRKDIHPRVVINEAIELAKQFASDDGYKFINGVLDKVSKSLANASAPAE